jgi:hypothetical protein
MQLQCSIWRFTKYDINDMSITFQNLDMIGNGDGDGMLVINFRSINLSPIPGSGKPKLALRQLDEAM